MLKKKKNKNPVYLVRKLKKMDQIEMANRLDVSQSYISKVETNKISPPIDFVINFCKTNKVHIKYFCDQWSKSCS